MTTKNDNIVGYFEYDYADMADAAISEQDRIRRLEKQVDYKNPRLVYAIYMKILSSDIFHTPEGYLYMVHLQEFLYDNEDKLPGDIPPIPYHNGYGKSAEIMEDGDKSAADYQNEIARLKSKIRELELDKSKAYKNIKIKNRKTDAFIYKMVIVALVFVVIAMLVISSLSNSPNIINYKEQIQNEYADWEQQLNEKERELNEREREMNKKAEGM